MKKEEIIKELYKKYPCIDAELFEQVLIPILQAQNQELLEMIEKVERDYSRTYNFKVNGVSEKYLPVIKVIVSDAYFAGEDRMLEDIKKLIK